MAYPLTSSETRSVPFVGLDRQHQPMRAQLREAVERVIDSSAFTLGSEVEAFENEWAASVGAGGCVGVSSGTSALRIALEAAGIGQGDEVIVPAHTFIASAVSIVLAGATPVFCDVRPGTGLIDPAAVRSAMTSRTAAVMCVHLYGQVCEMDELLEVTRSHGLMLIEDAAQAQGATRGGRYAGSLADVAAFSFYPSKNLGALGDGGAITSSDPELLEQSRVLRNLGQRRKGEHVLLAGNDRLDGLQAALLRVKVPYVDQWAQQRRDRAAAYRVGLDDVFTLLEEDPAGEPNYHLFPIRTPDRSALADALAARGIQTGIHYSPALHRQPPLVTYGRSDYPIAEAWAGDELSLPMFAELSDSEVEYVIEACRDSLASTDIR